MGFFDEKLALPLYSVRLDSGLWFSISAYGWFLSDNHKIYCEHKRSISYVSVHSLSASLKSYEVCRELPQDLSATDPVTGISNVTRHTVPYCQKEYCDNGPPYQVSMHFKSENCHVQSRSRYVFQLFWVPGIGGSTA